MVEIPGRRRKRKKSTQKTLMLAASMTLLVLFCLLLSTILPLGEGEAVTASSLQADLLHLTFSEVMSANRAAVPDDSGDFSDWIELTNQGDTPISLHNVGLSDDASIIRFLFPNLVLEPGACVLVYASDKTQALPDAALHAPFKISSAGETLYLFDSLGQGLAQLEIPAMDRDQSYALMEGSWTVTSWYTPGFPNTNAGYEAYRGASNLETSTLILNEILVKNRSVLADEDGDYSDIIELHNRSNYTLSLTGYGLSDDESKPLQWRFPQGTTIPANGYLIVYASGKNRDGSESPNLHTNFKINSQRETVLLSNSRGQLLDRVVVEGLDKDQSYGRHASSYEWQILDQASPGHANNMTGNAAFDAAARNKNGLGLFISEVITYSTGMETPHGTTSYDWIEIMNLNHYPISLKDYGLSDDPGRPRQWQFPDVTLQPGEYLLVFASGLSSPPSGSSALHASFRLSALGEIIVLSDPAGKIIDRLVVPRLEADSSYGRNIGASGFFYYDLPSPGVANSGGFTGYAEEPTMDLPGGMYDRAPTLTLSAPAGVTIRYTTDGSEPTEESELYQGPIEIPRTTVIRARGFAAGLQPSHIVTNTYFVGVYHYLPVISLVSDPWNLWNPDTGIYAGDYTQSSKTAPAYKDLPYWQKNTVAGHFEFFESDGSQVSSEDIELGLHGQYSLDIPQKSFRVTAKGRYGSTSLDHAFFPDLEYDTYQSLVLRNGGNDGKYTRIVDGFQSRIVDWVEDTTVYHMPTRPVVVYLNGKYWGHYNIRERVNIHSLARFEGWDDPDNIDLIKGNNQVLNGSFSDYKALLAYVKANDLNKPEALQKVLDWVDVDNYFDYMIFEMYFGNTDTGNIKFYRRNAPGEKWKWVLFDLDWGMFNSSNNGCKIVLNPKGTGVGNGFDNTIIRKLLDVPEMLDKFLTRYGQLYQNVFITQRMMDLAHEMAAELDPEMPMHFSRWAYDNALALDIEAPSNPEGAYSYWKGRLSRLDDTIRRRNYNVWGHVQEWFSLSDAQMIQYFGERPAQPE